MNILDSSPLKWEDYTDPHIGGEDVTVCIAGSCVFKDHAAILLCCDYQGNKGFISSDDVHKLRRIGNARVLIAGGLTSANELLNDSANVIKDFASKTSATDFDLEMNAYLGKLRQIAEKRKQIVVKNYLGLSLGLSPEEFWQRGRDYFPAANYDSILYEMRRLTLGATLIIGTISPNDEAVIVKLNEDGHVAWENHFAVSGSGGSIAEAFLCQYDYEDNMPAEDCFYRLYSAKVASEKNPHVGATTAFELLAADGSYGLSGDYFMYLNKKVRTYRPPKLRPFLEVGLEKWVDRERKDTAEGATAD